MSWLSQALYSLMSWDLRQKGEERRVETSGSEIISHIRPPSLSGDEGTTRKTGIHTLHLLAFNIILSWCCRLQLYPVGSRHLLTLSSLRLSGSSHPRAVVAAPGHFPSFSTADMMPCDKDTSSCRGGRGARN